MLQQVTLQIWINTGLYCILLWTYPNSLDSLNLLDNNRIRDLCWDALRAPS